MQHLITQGQTGTAPRRSGRRYSSSLHGYREHAPATAGSANGTASARTNDYKRVEEERERERRGILMDAALNYARADWHRPASIWPLVI